MTGIAEQTNWEVIKESGPTRTTFSGELNGESVVIKRGGVELYREWYILETIQRVVDSPLVPRPLSIIEENGFTYLIQNKFPGTPLSEYIGLSERLQSRPLAEEEAVEIATMLARAFTHIHQAGFIYRDLTLNHVIYDPTKLPGQQLGLVDLEACSIPDLNGQHYCQKARGTWSTMAPEEFEAYIGQELTPAANIYSLGVVMLQLLSGQCPLDMRHFLPKFTRPTKEFQGRVHAEQVIDVGEYVANPKLAQVIQKAIAKQPSERYQTMAEFLEALKDSK